VPPDSILREVQRQAEARGCLVFHSADPELDWGPGFPDLVIAYRGRVLFAEVKTADDPAPEDRRAWAWHLEPRTGLGRPTHLYAVIWPRDLFSGRVDQLLAQLGAE
jgi:hypothetical protein